MSFYPAALPLSTSTLNRVAGPIRRHRKTIGSRWHALDPSTQALLTLAYLHKGETLRPRGRLQHLGRDRLVAHP